MNESNCIREALTMSLKREEVDSEIKLANEKREIEMALGDSGLRGERMKIPGKVFKTLEKSATFYENVMESLRGVLNGDLDETIISETGFSPDSIRKAKMVNSELTAETLSLSFNCPEGQFGILYQKGSSGTVVSIS